MSVWFFVKNVFYKSSTVNSLIPLAIMRRIIDAVKYDVEYIKPSLCVTLARRPIVQVFLPLFVNIDGERKY